MENGAKVHNPKVLLLAAFVSQSHTSHEKQFCLSLILFLLGQKYVLICVSLHMFPIHCEIVDLFLPVAKLPLQTILVKRPWSTEMALAHHCWGLPGIVVEN